jgi:hypothetical protein
MLGHSALATCPGTAALFPGIGAILLWLKNFPR